MLKTLLQALINLVYGITVSRRTYSLCCIWQQKNMVVTTGAEICRLAYCKAKKNFVAINFCGSPKKLIINNFCRNKFSWLSIAKICRRTKAANSPSRSGILPLKMQLSHLGQTSSWKRQLINPCTTNAKDKCCNIQIALHYSWAKESLNFIDIVWTVKSMKIINP